MLTPKTIRTLPAIQTSRRSTISTKLALLCVALFALLGGAAYAQTSNNHSRPSPIPNTTKYRNRGLQPAKGRAGSATLTVRALLGKDGQTDVEMTTGSLDAPQLAPGNIKKAQLKPLDQNGEAIYARNYNGLTGGGYFKVTVNDLHHFQQVQAQTNIDGIDARRTNVVTVVETVKKRPDLALSSLKPATGLVGTPVVISALVRELNGDVGATANCVLYADGVEIDRANGIFVDAGDAVTVAFTQVFTSPGTRHIEVKLENVAPGDYDTTNNTIAGDLIIVQPDDSLNYEANFRDESNTSTSKEDHISGWNDPQFGWQTSYGNENSGESGSQAVSLNGYARQYSSFPYQFSVGETSDTATSPFSDTLTVEQGGSFSFDFGPFHYTTASGFAADDSQNVRVFVSNVLFKIDDTTQFMETTVQYDRFAGTVTYHSSSYAKYWYRVDGVRVDDYDYTLNSSNTTASGTRLPVGSQFGLNLALISGDTPAQVFSASPTMDITSSSSAFTNQPPCIAWRFPDPPATIYYSGSDCEQSSFTSVVKSGSASFNGAQ
ncbi:MAG: hypothetical protein QOE33_517 [Acidobacteriota bacterium]|nr:hypothetical protein [Acidobacteriota bacterium]